LAKHFKNIDNLKNATLDELTEVEEIGEKIAISVLEYFKNEKNISIIERLKKSGLRFEVEKRGEEAPQILSGKSIVVSGKFSSFSRNEIKDIIDRLGGKNVGSVSGKTDFLVAGEAMGPEKRRKAEKLGVKIISEDEFIKMIEQNESDEKQLNIWEDL
jgi:DNA ligase (NAD+)